MKICNEWQESIEMTFSNYKIRDANSHEDDLLSQLALRSKAIWGYDDDFMKACEPHIKIDKDYISNWPVVVIEINGEVVGFYSLKVISNENRLDNLWIEPKYIRKGFGKILFEDAVHRSKKLNWSYFRLAGEKKAIIFYEKMGAKLIGQIPSRLGKGITLPHMEYNLVENNVSDEDKYYKSLPKIRSASGVLIKNNKKYLIIKPSYRNYWEIPGGVVEHGESPLEAAIRETKEETNLDIKIDSLGIVDFKSEEGFKGDAIHFIFTGSIKEDSPKIKLRAGEIEDYKFATKEEVLTMLHEQVAMRVKAILQNTNSLPIYSEYGLPAI